MANYELKFIDSVFNQDYIKVKKYVSNKSGGEDDEQEVILIVGQNYDNIFEIVLDKSTAIKFAKTLRTEINKIQ